MPLVRITSAIAAPPYSVPQYECSIAGPTAPTDLRVTVDPERLDAGVYDAQIRVSATTLPGVVETVSVRFRFGDPPPEIEISVTEVAWDVLEGSSAIPTREVSIANRGEGILEGLEADVVYEAGGPGGWLSAILDASATPASLSRSVWIV